MRRENAGCVTCRKVAERLKLRVSARLTKSSSHLVSMGGLCGRRPDVRVSGRARERVRRRASDGAVYRFCCYYFNSCLRTYYVGYRPVLLTNRDVIAPQPVQTQSLNLLAEIKALMHDGRPTFNPPPGDSK